MREPQKKTIDGVTFEVTPLGFKQGRQAFLRLSKAAAPILGASDSLQSLALEKAVASVSEDDLDWFSDVFGRTTRFSKDGDKWPFLNAANQEVLFSGRLTLFFRWLIFACEVNFSDFLGLLKSGETGGGPKPGETRG